MVDAGVGQGWVMARARDGREGVVPEAYLERAQARPQDHSMKQVLCYQELEGRLVQLLGSNTLHWRQQEMGVDMLLSMITYDHTPSLDTTQLWLSLLVSGSWLTR